MRVVVVAIVASLKPRIGAGEISSSYRGHLVYVQKTSCFSGLVLDGKCGLDE